VFDPGKRKEYFLEITSHCWVLLQDQLPECDSLRGLRVTFTRSPGANNGRLRATLDAVAKLEVDLPASRDPNRTFEVLWKRQDDIDPLSLTA
jgi:hypothetical protein